MKTIVLCADDYGQNISISQAIIELLKKNRLSATSCMVTSANWKAAARDLESVKNAVDIGLHFNLTEGQSISNKLMFLPLSKLLIKASLRQLDQAAIEGECHAQIDSFAESLGQLPDFLDGHQHVHQFPVIRDAVLAVYKQRLQARGAYLRCVDSPKNLLRFTDSAYIKRVIIQFSGAAAFKRQLIKYHIPHNVSFAGIYDFSANYKNIFSGFLRDSKSGGLIMCHPGLNASAEPDAIAAARCQEYQYFLSEDFVQECVKQKVRIARFSNSCSPELTD